MVWRLHGPVVTGCGFPQTGGVLEKFYNDEAEIVEIPNIDKDGISGRRPEGGKNLIRKGEVVFHLYSM